MNKELPNHIGWQLWQASRNWTETFVMRLQAAGYPGVTLALANVLGHLSRDKAVRQTQIADRAGLTKQAIGQFLEELEKLNLIERIPDPADGRARLVQYSNSGRKFLNIADQIKSEIEDEYEAKIGPQNLEDLKKLIDALQ
jgi:DNA-binding MarR family transcriptional regulator